jgi:hypothetical protein
MPFGHSLSKVSLNNLYLTGKFFKNNQTDAHIFNGCRIQYPIVDGILR